jgi:toxin HigB-1
MQLEFRTGDLARLATEPSYRMKLPDAVVIAYRKRVQSIRAAIDERALREPKSHCFKKLQGDRDHQRSMRLNDQFRLILEITEGDPKTVLIVDIEDYH